MKVSVLIIAKNEESYIAQCIESVLNQTQKPEEVILVIHNSTDRTKQIAEKYPISIVTFSGQEGIVYARLEGLKHVSGEIILCIDGDSYAEQNWAQELVKLLLKGNVLVGSWVKFTGTAYSKITNIWHSWFAPSRGRRAIDWIWGPSMGFWSKDKQIISEILNKSIVLTSKLKLTRNPDDYIIAKEMIKRGNIEVTNKTFVTCNTKELDSLQSIRRSIENIINSRKLTS